MLRFATRRLLVTIPVLVGASLLVFVAVTSLPGDPVRAIGGRAELAPETRAAITERYRLDQPVVVRWGGWLRDVATGDLGESFSSRRPVRNVLLEKLPVTLRLAGMTLAIEAVIGVLAGVLASWRRQRFIDALVLVTTTVALAIPVFVLASLTRDLLGIRWQLVPATGRDGELASYVVPAMVLAAPTLALVARLTRASLDAELDAPYLTTVAAQGVSPARQFVAHALRNSWAPVIAFLATDLGALLAGAVVVESVFDLDGIGRALEQAIVRRDQPVIIGFTVLGILVYLLANLAADLAVAALDPRVRDA